VLAGLLLGTIWPSIRLSLSYFRRVFSFFLDSGYRGKNRGKVSGVNLIAWFTGFLRDRLLALFLVKNNLSPFNYK